MRTVDYTRLFEPPTRLSVHKVKDGHIVTDQHGNVFTYPPRDLASCERFMRAAVEYRDAVVDGFSMRVDNVVQLRKETA